MEISILLAAFLLGLSASPNCLAVCMPVMVPMITSDKDSSPKRGFYFSIYFSLGRLLVYMVFAAIIGYIGYTLLDLDPVDETSGGELAARIIMTIIAVVIIIYAIQLYRDRIPAVTCPGCFFPKTTQHSDEGSENEMNELKGDEKGGDGGKEKNEVNRYEKGGDSGKEKYELKGDEEGGDSGKEKYELKGDEEGGDSGKEKYELKGDEKGGDGGKEKYEVKGDEEGGDSGKEKYELKGDEKGGISGREKNELKGYEKGGDSENEMNELKGDEKGGDSGKEKYELKGDVKGGISGREKNELKGDVKGGDGGKEKYEFNRKEKSENSRVRSIPVMFGFLFGSIVCPPFLILLGTTLISSGPFTAMLAALLFWIGTLPVNLLAGAFSGGLGRRWRKKSENEPSFFVTKVSAMTLMMVGIWWLFLVLI